MASIAQYQSDIAKYQALKAKLSGIVSRLDYAANSMGAVNLELESSYRVDGGATTIASRSANLRKSISATADSLRRVMNISIDSAIENARRQIAYLQEQERKRRAAAEAERRRREEEQKRQQKENKGTKEEKISTVSKKR